MIVVRRAKYIADCVLFILRPVNRVVCPFSHCSYTPYLNYTHPFPFFPVQEALPLKEDLFDDATWVFRHRREQMDKSQKCSLGLLWDVSISMQGRKFSTRPLGILHLRCLCCCYFHSITLAQTAAVIPTPPPCLNISVKQSKCIKGIHNKCMCVHA